MTVFLSYNCIFFASAYPLFFCVHMEVNETQNESCLVSLSAACKMRTEAPDSAEIVNICIDVEIIIVRYVYRMSHISTNDETGGSFINFFFCPT